MVIMPKPMAPMPMSPGPVTGSVPGAGVVVAVTVVDGTIVVDGEAVTLAVAVTLGEAVALADGVWWPGQSPEMCVHVEVMEVMHGLTDQARARSLLLWVSGLALGHTEELVVLLLREVGRLADDPAQHERAHLPQHNIDPLVAARAFQ